VANKHYTNPIGRQILFDLEMEWLKKLHRLFVTSQTELKTDHYGDGSPLSEQETVSTLMRAEQKGYPLTLRGSHIHWHEPVKNYTAYRYTPETAPYDWTDSEEQKHNASAYQAPGCYHFAIFRVGHMEYVQVQSFQLLDSAGEDGIADPFKKTESRLNRPEKNESLKLRL